AQHGESDGRGPPRRADDGLAHRSPPSGDSHEVGIHTRMGHGPRLAQRKYGIAVTSTASSLVASANPPAYSAPLPARCTDPCPTSPPGTPGTAVAEPARGVAPAGTWMSSSATPAGWSCCSMQ